MPKVQQSTRSLLQSFVLEFKDKFTSNRHILFCVLCGNFFFLMHINTYYNDFRSIFVYFLEL
jgi:hypothetical protein